MTTYTREQLAEILRLHGMWRRGETGGVRADLTGANLRGAYLTGANLSGADLTKANLTEADLRGANLTGANLSGADLTKANLRGAYLSGADLTKADLTGANLRGAYLSCANLCSVNLTDVNLTGADLRGTLCRSLPSDRYLAYTVPSDDGQILCYGCERRTLADWEANVAAICKRHAPDEAERYEAEIRALIAYCRIVEKEAK